MFFSPSLPQGGRTGGIKNMAQYNTNPVWTQLDSPERQYTWLDSSITCGTCVIGGGLTGVLCAMRLAEQGEDVALITQGQIGYGSTAAAMPCAEYDCGTTMRALISKNGKEKAERMLWLGVHAVENIEKLAKELDGDFGFCRRDCFLFTDDDADLELITREYLDRRSAGIDCTYVSRSAARDAFAFDVAGGIVSAGLAAQLDPYMLTQLCAARAASLGARIFENTRAERIDPRDGGAAIATSTHRTITTPRVVIAAGDACAELLDGMYAQKTGFLAVSHRIRQFTGWPGRCVIRSFSSPHVTYAASPDGRIFASGLATSVIDEQARLCGLVHAPAIAQRRFAELEAGAKYLFPGIGMPGFEYANISRCCRTTDGLPIVGWSEENESCMFAAACGEGGVIMSEVVSHIIASMCAGEEPEELAMLHPGRRALVR